MIDVSAERGWLAATLRTQQIMQMVIQARWVQDSPLLTLPHLEARHLLLFKKKGSQLQTLPGLRSVSWILTADILGGELDEGEIQQVSVTISQTVVDIVCYKT
jgi:activating signal cointegrator complex subunit 3